MTQKNSYSDKRHSVRIDSRVLFAADKISREDFEKIDADCKNGISLYNRHELADMQVYRSAQNALNRIKEKDRDLADFLQHLDSKLDLLMNKMEATPTLFNSFELQKVNLGGNGLGFWSSSSYEVGDLVEAHIVVPLDNYYINCFAEVIDSTQEEEDDVTFPDRNRVAVRFILITEQDREVLVRFNFKQQSQVLQNRRLNQKSL